MSGVEKIGAIVHYTLSSKTDKKHGGVQLYYF